MENQKDSTNGKAIIALLCRLLKHLRFLLPLGLVVGAIVGALFGDVLFGLTAGVVLSLLWGVLLALFQRLSGAR
jgi:hypothetical protein